MALEFVEKNPVLTNYNKTKEYPTDNLTKQNIANIQYKFKQYNAINHAIALVKKADTAVFLDAANIYEE